MPMPNYRQNYVRRKKVNGDKQNKEWVFRFTLKPNISRICPTEHETSFTGQEVSTMQENE